MKLQLDGIEWATQPCDVKVIWEDVAALIDGEIEKDVQVHLKATEEGIVVDVIEGDGFVVKTNSFEVQDLVDMCK
jgi:hypothetical protein